MEFIIAILIVGGLGFLYYKSRKSTENVVEPSVPYKVEASPTEIVEAPVPKAEPKVEVKVEQKPKAAKPKAAKKPKAEIKPQQKPKANKPKTNKPKANKPKAPKV